MRVPKSGNFFAHFVVPLLAPIRRQSLQIQTGGVVSKVVITTSCEHMKIFTLLNCLPFPSKKKRLGFWLHAEQNVRYMGIYTML
jgi:hypothetical protein